MSPVKLSVVIPTFNRGNALQRTLPALLGQAYPPADCEIVVVVDGSIDGTLEFLGGLKSPFRLKVITQPNRGPAVARNTGLRAAEGDLVLFLDDDLICTPGLLSQHWAAHADAGPLLAQGPIYVAPESPRTLARYFTEASATTFYAHFNPTVGFRLPHDIYSIINSSIRRETLLACGGLDESAPGWEDIELGLRLWTRGVRFQYLPCAAVHEFYVKSSKHLLEKYARRRARGTIYLSRKYPEYRPYTSVAETAGALRLKRLVRNLAVRAPLSPVPLLKPALWIAERFSAFVSVRKAGIGLLNYAMRIEAFRSALQEAGSWKALRREFGMQLPVLLYHHVGPLASGGDHGLTVSPAQFEAQVRWLARRGYAGIRPSDWLAWRQSAKPLPEKPVLLTFDDAYADIADHALPVLERHGFGAAVFVITGKVGATVEWPRIKSSFRLMSAEQIRYWAKRGIEFGAHSRTHPDLTTLGPAELADEVAGSKSDLEAILRSPVVSFAYPYGPYNQSVCDCVRGLYDLAFTTDEGLNDLRTDPYLLRRTGPCPDDFMLYFAGRVRCGYNPFERVRTRVRLRTRLKNAARVLFARSH